MPELDADQVVYRLLHRENAGQQPAMAEENPIHPRNRVVTPVKVLVIGGRYSQRMRRVAVADDVSDVFITAFSGPVIGGSGLFETVQSTPLDCFHFTVVGVLTKLAWPFANAIDAKVYDQRNETVLDIFEGSIVEKVTKIFGAHLHSSSLQYIRL